MKVSRKIEYIKEWILKYCKSMLKPANSLVVGASGGIDSSLVVSFMKETAKKPFGNSKTSLKKVSFFLYKDL